MQMLEFCSQIFFNCRLGMSLYVDRELNPQAASFYEHTTLTVLIADTSSLKKSAS